MRVVSHSRGTGSAGALRREYGVQGMGVEEAFVDTKSCLTDDEQTKAISRFSGSGRGSVMDINVGRNATVQRTSARGALAQG